MNAMLGVINIYILTVAFTLLVFLLPKPRRGWTHSRALFKCLVICIHVKALSHLMLNYLV